MLYANGNVLNIYANYMSRRLFSLLYCDFIVNSVVLLQTAQNWWPNDKNISQ